MGEDEFKLEALGKNAGTSISSRFEAFTKIGNQIERYSCLVYKDQMDSLIVNNNTYLDIWKISHQGQTKEVKYYAKYIGLIKWEGKVSNDKTYNYTLLRYQISK